MRKKNDLLEDFFESIMIIMVICVKMNKKINFIFVIICSF